MKKKRVLLPPATRSPKLEDIKAAVEEVAAEREKRTGKKKVVARRLVAGRDTKE